MQIQCGRGSVRADLGARAHSALSGREVSAHARQAKQAPLEGRSGNKINERTNKGRLNEESEEERMRASECVCVVVKWKSKGRESTGNDRQSVTTAARCDDRGRR